MSVGLGQPRQQLWKGAVTAMIQIGFVSVDSAEWGDAAETMLTAIAEKI